MNRRRPPECRRWIDTYGCPARCKLTPGHEEPCQPFRVLDSWCDRCGAPMRVVEGSAADLDHVCNLCVFAEARRAFR